MLQISESAYQYLLRKSKLYFSQGRLPRLILVAQSCSGAKFAVCFDKPGETDQVLRYGDIQILVEPGLVEKYGGFDLDTEQFFFAPRLLIKPHKNSFKCDCNEDCVNKEVINES